MSQTVETESDRATVEDYRAVDGLLRGDLRRYSSNLVKIKDKDSESLVPFRWNGIQRYLDRELEKQREEQGKIRALILKARQLGVSTYVGIRYYRRTSLWMSQSTYILTHEDQATQNLFGMAKRVHDNMPEDYRPRATMNNANELQFGLMDSGYRVGTAKNISGLGRSQTIQNFHGSEVAYWPQAQVHFGGVMQAVPDLPGTEIILESTAKGVGGVFYEQWHLAERGLSEFIPIFLPWYWAEEYRRSVPPGWEPSPEEATYGELFNLDLEQLCWMHFKNITLGARPGEICIDFRVEYPATSQEAFQTSGIESFILPEYVLKARKWTAPNQDHAARVMGVDTAWGGKSYTRLLDRQGRKLGGRVNLMLNLDDVMEIAGVIAREILTHEIQMTFIDVTGGCGSGPLHRLRELGFGDRVRGINFSNRALDPIHFRNKRAEMWWGLREWLKDSGGADIPDDDVLHRHICAPTARRDSNQRWVLELKEKIMARLGFSPDGGDAAALTFAETVIRPTSEATSWRDELQTDYGRKNDWMTA